MSYWSGEKLNQRLPTLVTNFDQNKVDCSAYTLTVGSEAYITPDHTIPSASRHTARKLNKDESIAIPPGQFGFLLTEEEVEIPDDAMAFISMKTTIKFKGLINASGFHVDPGFRGRLIFAVFNAGPNPVHLKRGMPLFLIWFADLDQQTMMKKTGIYRHGISSSIVNGISGEIQSAHSLSESLKSLEKSVSIVKTVLWLVVPVVATITAMVIGTFISLP